MSEEKTEEEYVIRACPAGGQEAREVVPPSRYVSHEHRARVVFANTVYSLRKARTSATVELLKNGEAIASESVTPNDKFIASTRSIPGHAHTRIWGTFSGPVTQEDIKKWLYHPMFGGRELSINWNDKTFYGVRHDD